MPKTAPRPCPKHPSILVTKDSPCPDCPAHGWKPDKVRGNRHQRGYGADWDKTRVRILKRDGYLCQCTDCKKHGRLRSASEVDHIIPKAQGGTGDDDNLQAINTNCHKLKTERERND